MPSRKLTDRFVRTVDPDRRQRLQYQDSVQEGLVLQVEPLNDGQRAAGRGPRRTYKLYYSRFGRPRWYTLGSAGVLNLAEARAEARRQLARMALDERLDVQRERRQRRRAETFAELAERYVEEYAKRRNKSWRQADSLVRRYLLPPWGSRAASDIHRADVRAVFRQITETGAPILANQVLAAAGAVFSWAIREEVVDLPANPCRGIERNPTTRRSRMLGDTELRLIWPAFDACGPVKAAALRVLLLTGQRPGEVLRMRWDQINDGWWLLSGQPDTAKHWPGTKNGEEHRVWLSDPVVELLSHVDQTAGLVFANPRQRPFQGLAGDMRRLSDRLGLEPRVTAHDLRRTHGSTVTRLGFGRDAMNRLQNHREGGIADTYDWHSYETENREVQEAVARHMLTIVDGAPDTNVIPLRAAE
jgi:integrase